MLVRFVGYVVTVLLKFANRLAQRRPEASSVAQEQQQQQQKGSLFKEDSWKRTVEEWLHSLHHHRLLQYVFRFLVTRLVALTCVSKGIFYCRRARTAHVSCGMRQRVDACSRLYTIIRTQKCSAHLLWVLAVLWFARAVPMA